MPFKISQEITLGNRHNANFQLTYSLAGLPQSQ